MEQFFKSLLSFFGAAILALFAGFVFAGLSASGVISMHVTHVCFWIAFLIAFTTISIWSWHLRKSIIFSSAAALMSMVIVGGGLWWLNDWLTEQKAAQDAANRPPSSIQTVAPAPQVPIVKTVQQVQVVEQHETKGRVKTKIQQNNSGGTSAQQESNGNNSPNVSAPNGIAIGGNNFGNPTVNNFGPPPPPPIQLNWSVLSKSDTEKVVTVTTNETFSPVAVAVRCDSPPESVTFANHNGMAASNVRTGIEGNIAFIYFEGTALRTNDELYVTVSSSKPFTVLDVKPAKIKGLND